MNRLTWALDRKGVVALDADDDDAEPSGPAVVPGDYSVRITVGDYTTEGSIEVRPDPRRAQSVAMVEANMEIYWTGQGKLAELSAAIRRLEDTESGVTFYSDRLEAWDGEKAVGEDLTARSDSVSVQITALLDQLRQPPGTGIRADKTITSKLRNAVNEATNSPFTPSAGRREQVDRAMNEADETLALVVAFYATELPAYQAALHDAGFDPLGG